MTQIAECKVCGHIERSILPEMAMRKIADHLIDEHGLTESEIMEYMNTAGSILDDHGEQYTTMAQEVKIDVARQNVIELLAEVEDNPVVQHELEEIEHRLCLVAQILKQDTQL